MNLFTVRAEDRACTTKIWYPTKHQAKKAWKRLRRQPGRRHLELYSCWFCGLYHLGNPRGHQTYIRVGRPSIAPAPAAPRTPLTALTALTADAPPTGNPIDSGRDAA